MTKTLTATKARKEFFKLIEKSEQPGSTIIITLNGIAKTIMMSVQNFEDWQETLEIMSDKDLMKGIKKGLRDIKEKKWYSAQEVKKKLNLDQCSK